MFSWGVKWVHASHRPHSPAVNDVVAFAPRNRIVSGTPDNAVIAVSGLDHVGTAVTNDDIVPAAGIARAGVLILCQRVFRRALGHGASNRATATTGGQFLTDSA